MVDSLVESIIDPHYRTKHPDVSDEIILKLVEQLNDTQSEIVSERDGFSYLARELSWDEKHYRLVLTYCDEDFIGVVNAFRVKEKK